MDIYRLKEHLDMANIMGATLNVEERLRIDLALGKLIEENPGIEQFKFWGRINGTAKSYYIIVGYNYQTYEFPRKTFFWAVDPNFKFTKLIENLYEQHRVPIEKTNGMFVGDPAKILVNLEGEEGEAGEEAAENPPAEQGVEKPKQEVDSQKEENIAPPKKNFTELNRLSIVVKSIQNDCQVIPVGSYKMSPQHSLHTNQAFKCKSSESCINLNQWQHFRAPQTQSKRYQIQSQIVIFRQNFLDPIQSDNPIGCWSAQVDATGTNVTIRNLAWPGYFAYQKCNSGLFGSCYFGDGRKNVDLAFQL